MKKGLTGSQLKLFALITMLIDHIGAVVIYPFVNRYSWSFLKPWTFFQIGDPLCVIYFFLRVIGRVSFPIFCFMIVEGFYHTRSKIKYATQLLIFGIISEIPFDLALRHTVLEFGNQNVFFTLFIGLMVISTLSFVRKKMDAKSPKIMIFENSNRYIILICLEIVIICIGMLTGIVCKVDYSKSGVLCIAVIYMLKELCDKGEQKNKSTNMKAMAAGTIALASFEFLEAVTFLDIPLISMYNGKRGKGFKYLFYIFYPAHLLVLYGIYLLVI